MSVKYPNIEAERARNGMSKTALAEMLEVNRRTVYNWVHCGKIPITKLERMSEFFNCSIEYLLRS